MFVYPSLHCRSCYSLMRGVLSPREICLGASREGGRAVGMADVNGFYGLADFHQEARRQGIKPVTALEVIWGKESLFSAFCLSRKGYALLNELLSAMKSSPEKRRGTSVSFHPLGFLLDRGWEGLVLVSALPRVLEALADRDRSNVFAALFYGTPFSGLFAWAGARGVPSLALSAGVYRTPGEQQLHALLRAIDNNTTTERLDPKERLPESRRFASSREMEAFFSAVPEALANTLDLADRAEGDLLPRGFVFPRFDGMPEEESGRKLASLCREGILRRYGPGNASGGASPGEVNSRLEYELGIIREKQFAGYFLVVWDIVSRFPRTCGRGSSAASIVSYLLGITHVDPLKYNLFFERFLHRDRMDPPDIDVDFPWDEREKAQEYVFKRYPGRAGLVADHVTFARRSCVREAARAFGFSETEISRMIRAWRSGHGDALPEYLLRAARALQGRPRYIGTHPGGVVITPEPITRYTHVQPGGTGFPVIAWEKDGTESAGLVKIDLLGNRSLGVLRDTITLVNPLLVKEGKPPLLWESFNPVGDPAVEEFIESGDTMGIFYVESPATRQLLKKMGHGDYLNLVAASSIIRPAANRWISEFVRRLKGGAFTPPPGPVAEVLKETMGIMVYQEDVARVAMAAAGFSASQADGLRKVMSKKDREQKLPDFRERFLAGGRARGLDAVQLDELWEAVLSFQGYSFCKAHSASYALVSYRLAWLKLHFPLEFFAGVINNGGGFYSRQVYLNALRRRGFSILSPDINVSQVLCTVEGRALRVGLVQLAGIDRNFLVRLLVSREEQGRFAGFIDFLDRLSPGFAEIRILIRSGALDSLSEGKSRPQLFWIFYHRQKERDLFGLPGPPELAEYSDMVRVADEIRFLNVVVSRHPLEIFLPRIRTLERAKGVKVIDSRSLKDRQGERVTLAGTLVTEKETRTKNRKIMCFVSFEDPYGVFETVFFPETYERHAPLLETGIAFLVTGLVEADFDVIQIQAEELVSLSRQNSPAVSPVTVHSSLDR